MGVCLATSLADASDKERQRARDVLCRGKIPLRKAEQWSAEGAYLIAELRPRGGVLTVAALLSATCRER